MIQLETYKGTRTRHTCPECGKARQFSRFINTETGEYLADNVGICNRASNCGYSYTPKQFFADNPTGSNFKPKARRTDSFYGNVSNKKSVNHFANLQSEPTTFDLIPFESFKTTLGNYDQNNFVKFLFNLFPDCAREIQDILKMYFVGTFADYRGNYTCFPSIDAQNRICRAKLIRFNPDTGKRLKGEFDTSSLPAKLKMKDFNYKQIFFGEHLLPKYPNKPAAIVEAEKTAIVGSLCFPEFVWLGCNSLVWLNSERVQRLGNRQIILYPDADGFARWQSVALDAARRGSSVKVSNLIETNATEQQKAGGFDLADYLINQQTEINNTNNLIDSYNAKLEKVLSDEKLFDQFNTILDEQIAVCETSGNLSRDEAERIKSDRANIREIVLSL